MLDVSLLGEVNFFPYLNPMGWDTSRNTIYATVGPGVAIKYKNKHGGKGAKIPLIVMGVGYKRVLGSRFALEVEWAFRLSYNLWSLGNKCRTFEKENDL